MINLNNCYEAESIMVESGLEDRISDLLDLFNSFIVDELHTEITMVRGGLIDGSTLGMIIDPQKDDHPYIYLCEMPLASTTVVLVHEIGHWYACRYNRDLSEKGANVESLNLLHRFSMALNFSDEEYNALVRIFEVIRSSTVDETSFEDLFKCAQKRMKKTLQTINNGSGFGKYIDLIEREIKYCYNWKAA